MNTRGKKRAVDYAREEELTKKLFTTNDVVTQPLENFESSSDDNDDCAKSDVEVLVSNQVRLFSAFVT